MAWAQKNYNELQGRVNPANGLKPRYRIAQIGCYLTAYCNLLEAFGKSVSPLQLNAYFRDNAIYTDVDDGLTDDLSNTAITRYNPNIVLTGTGYTGVPPHANAIVKFRFQGANGFNTHFTKVDHVDNKGHVWVIDSYDGVLKDGTAKWGRPLRWDTYEDRTPKPKPAPAASIQPEQYIVQTGEGISHALKNRGYPDYGNAERWQWLAERNGFKTWQEFRLSPGQVITVPLYVAPAPQPEVVVVPVIVQEPEQLTPVAETPVHNIPVVQPAEETSVEVEKPKHWQDSWTEEDKEYESLVEGTVLDQAGVQIPLKIHKGDHVKGAGYFTRDFLIGGVKVTKKFIRIQKHVEADYWYGVDRDLLRPVIEEQDSDDLFMLPIEEPGEKITLNEEVKEYRKNLNLRRKLVDLLGRLWIWRDKRKNKKG